MADRKWSSASDKSVPLPSGLISKISRIILNTCERPFFGGMNRSILSEKSIAPTLSLFPIALKARTAANSVMRSLLLTPFVPSSEEPLMSARMNTVNSLSSSKTFTYGAPIRAVTFQSIERTSSPCWYSRFSLNAIPRPLNALAYSPEKILSLKPRDLISTRLTRLSSSTVSISSIPVQDYA